ncbi:MAG: calcium/sodium antiporter [Planctomycetes bacterium]|nr:calcium/sodium antiporter [Planctomycetota bacterium]
MDVLLIVFGLVLVTLGAELLVRGASALALAAGVSPLFIGLTIVGFGTSSPELSASLTASAQGATDVAVGNVVGSNLFNIAVILGLTALLKPIRVHFPMLRREVLVALGAAAVPWLALLSDGVVSRAAGAALLLFLIGHLAWSYRAARRASARERALAAVELRDTLDLGTSASSSPTRRARPWLDALLVLVGLLLLVQGSRTFVTSAISLAHRAGISELVIGLTIVSVGTSLPELVTSVVAAFRGSPDIALGNVLGSNVFNSFGILGTCAVVRPQAVPHAVLVFDTPAVLLATLLVIPIMRSGGVISRVEGGVLLAAYGGYLALLLTRGG